MITQEEFKKQIEHPVRWGKDFDEEMAIKATIQRTLRLVLKYPELAQEYADQLPKATMDENK
jgi:hypothetical protein